jgi:hypothetical protein
METPDSANVDSIAWGLDAGEKAMVGEDEGKNVKCKM